jgi:hypothetical protein
MAVSQVEALKKPCRLRMRNSVVAARPPSSSGDAEQAGEDEALLSLARDEHVGEQACGQPENDPSDDAHSRLLSQSRVRVGPVLPCG